MLCARLPETGKANLKKAGPNTTARFRVSHSAGCSSAIQIISVVELIDCVNKGIADGAGLPFSGILILNIRTEIAFGMFNDGCTSLYWKTQHDSILAQNWNVSFA